MNNNNQNVYRHRVNFGKIASPMNPPQLLQIQTGSYKWFLQKEIHPEQREDQGLESVFRSVFPINDYSGICRLEYISYRLGEPKYEQDVCRIKGVTYSAPIRVSLRLIIWDQEGHDDKKNVHAIKEQEIYLGEFPLMTETGSFIINGTERVIVNQLHKSPGVFFSHDKGKNHSSGKLLYHCGIIPQRGSWVDFEFDIRDHLYVRIDRKRKFFATILLRALGFTTEELLERFYTAETIDLLEAFGKPAEERVYTKSVEKNATQNQKAFKDIIHPDTNEIIVRVGRKITKSAMAKIKEAKISKIHCGEDDIIGRYSLKDVCDAEGEIIVECNAVVTEEILQLLLEKRIAHLKLIYMGPRTIGNSLRETLAVDKINSVSEALIEIYKKIKPGDPPTGDAAKNMLKNMFFNSDRFDLSRVGRMKLSRKLGQECNLDNRVLSEKDIMSVVAYLLSLKEGIGEIDDIDHLGNRRVRSVGELLEQRYRVGLVRVERAIKERMSLQEPETMTLHDIVNSKPITAVINEFFGSSPLSQFMDQTNPLSEITHKRRLSALGPGGLTRERAGFEVRDVHTSHYGRICPVETPEGPNIGLISSLAVYARLSEFGFIETPYRKVNQRHVTDDIEYMTAMDEDQYKIAQANAPLDEKSFLNKNIISCRERGEFKSISKDDVEYMDVAPQQLVSVAASIIPFLEHDDANRALMGSNMQRQAVPTIKPQAPFVGTGLEYQVARDSGSCLLAKRSGVVDSVDSSRIVIIADVNIDAEEETTGTYVDIYHLSKYHRSNQNTCINQRPLVTPGMHIHAGQILTDGTSCEAGELALGQNILMAFMPWNGYNYEDSILVSEKLLHEDRFTSIHIEEKEVMARDTKLGPESITRDLPNASEETVRNLDASGIIRIGSYVKTNDILVGKTTPKGESQLTPEERLLRSIFGDKAGDVRDTSLKTPQGIEGVVIDVKIFNRRDIDHDERTKEIERHMIDKIKEDWKDEVRVVKTGLAEKLMPLISGEPLIQDVLNPETNEIVTPAGTILTTKELKRLPEGSLNDIQIDDIDKNIRLNTLTQNATLQFEMIRNVYEQKIEREKNSTDLPPGVIRTVKVYIAMKRRLSVGDKMAGRHGNKGVISKIVPIEEMPYMEDGMPVDIVLNPLGVPSRMNVGQVLEVHLGLAAKKLGDKINAMLKTMDPMEEIKKTVKEIYNSPSMSQHLDSMNNEEAQKFVSTLKNGVHMATPVFDGAKEEEIHRLMDLCGLKHSGKLQLRDGRTGDAFSQKVTVGYMYILKLHHLVDDKIHSRSTGPYSLVTQQPLGGKAQFGGQRFGEMEVWALEAYGAAYTLRELLTVKSDDVSGRNKVYESIVKGFHMNQTGIPESFKVLLNEMKSLCLELKLIKDVSYLEGEDVI